MSREKRSITYMLIGIFLTSLVFGQTYLINKGFEAGMPIGWTGTASIGTTPYAGSGSLDFSLNEYIITPQVTDPDMIKFYYTQDNKNSAGVLNVFYDTDPSGVFSNQIGSPISIPSTGWSSASLPTNLGEGNYNFKIILTSAQNGSRVISVDDIVVTQSIVPSETSLSGFIAEPDAPSPIKSFTVSGADLIANIVLNAPANYEISTTSGSGFASSLTLRQSGETVASTPIYVRLKAGLSQGSYHKENII